MAGPLIVSVSGIHAQTLPRAAELAAWTDSRGVPLSLLVTPRLCDGRRLFDDRVTVAWLRMRRDGSDAIVLHGYHADAGTRRGEFGALSRREAELRLAAADGLLDQLGLPTRLFAAPRWALSREALQALARNGFRLSIEQRGVRDLCGGRLEDMHLLDLRARVRPAAVQRVARQVRSGRAVRLAVSAERLCRPEVRALLRDAIVTALDNGAHPEVYRCVSDRRAAA
ncbi:DUF2334 domain-containing protein [Rhodococcus sp. D2-41]|uniref:DUF2334 domain-containing protein n=1 Tax=Speluncibacter jeojiensis TaxID=2710754 RepID=UPI00240F619D|nr:DUF2334 domain-containing protein [Rhodococcus sp. D2-41]MDG3011562.1 DUF2334 domain-containing protein [Rhodococcus sp. D2-41]